MAHETHDAIVIGAGVIGCSVANALAADGRSVVVVERGAGAGCGSTSASSAVIRYNYSTRVGVAVAWESAQAWTEWASFAGPDDAGLARFIRTGGLTLESPEQDFDRVASLFADVGVPYEIWDAAAIRQRMPMIDPGRHHPPKALEDARFWDDADGVLRGLWTPDSGFVDDPQLAAHNLMAAAVRNGATFLFRNGVTRIERDGDRVTGVLCEDGSVLSARAVVNVAGPHSAVINRMAGVETDFSVRTRPMRQEVHEVRAPDGYGQDGPGPLVADMDLGVYFRGTPGGGLLIGGMEPECDPLEWLDDADDYDPQPTKPRFDAQVIRTARRLPDLGVVDRPRGIAGVYDVSDDWIPIYDRTSLDGYYVAIGTSGNQFKNAPVVGGMLAAIVDASENGRDHDADPVHHVLPRTGLEVNLGHYSRNRVIEPSSTSFTVMG
ncbi:FAD-dependent oxidoreductase [Streptosporangium sp. NPDC051022]|uniref:NAD(P)/FAD-dependent oxidoreductase n=1 Tax=Streptosporangium sp. NPDC051022 TaxID=3155752 RepID=UPI00342E46F4